MRLTLMLGLALACAIGCRRDPGPPNDNMGGGEAAAKPKVYTPAELLKLPAAEREVALDAGTYEMHTATPAEVEQVVAVAVPRVLSRLSSKDAAERLAVTTFLSERVLTDALPSVRDYRLRRRPKLDVEPADLLKLDYFLNSVAARPDVLDALAGALGDPDPAVEAQAGAALALLGPRAAPAAPALRRYLGADAPSPRVLTAEVLWWVTRDAPGAAKPLAGEFRSTDPARQRTAAVAVRSMVNVPSASQVGAKLGQVLPDRKRMHEQFSHPAVIPAIKTAVFGASDHLEFGEADAERLIGAEGGALLAGVIATTEDTAADRSDAAAVLSRTPAALAAVVKFPPRDPKGRDVVMEAAGRVIKGHPESVARMRMLDALQSAGPEAAPTIPAVIEVVGHRDPRVRQRAAEVLGSFGEAAKAAVPVLVKGLQDEDLDARYAAGQALKRVDPESAKKALVP